MRVIFLCRLCRSSVSTGVSSLRASLAGFKGKRGGIRKDVERGETEKHDIRGRERKSEREKGRAKHKESEMKREKD
ncbi:hypothetical protein EVAR_645_1 [Eumeta japonica]|uniref:Uncharacterized protein n=1 Tax=Eumeta variegata TaxID=151549 RepID=A0A4C1SDH8_EUMVA|nr:hypothetical protein EVAR_645_1 [Eumeta japonica]